ncbi:lactate/malate family dehydrogenase [Flavobacterium cellulosilyticum]|uniref:Lactate/malate dehydrogenase N-terminal domain-containing protein n=1 Tax=Flavobacterium cellulosilyticum TaxID=2541731 RepID=A0A4R5CAE7_9FLAO|nr:hypothetical protein E0F76_09660 [Flavobacterium cellulosilyticum]
MLLINKNELLAKDECIHLNHILSFAQLTKIYAAGFKGCKETDIVVITAGAIQKPGQTRTDFALKEIENTIDI